MQPGTFKAIAELAVAQLDFCRRCNHALPANRSASPAPPISARANIPQTACIYTASNAARDCQTLHVPPAYPACAQHARVPAVARPAHASRSGQGAFDSEARRMTRQTPRGNPESEDPDSGSQSAVRVAAGYTGPRLCASVEARTDCAAHGWSRTCPLDLPSTCPSRKSVPVASSSESSDVCARAPWTTRARRSAHDPAVTRCPAAHDRSLGVIRRGCPPMESQARLPPPVWASEQPRPHLRLSSEPGLAGALKGR
jgi:hypothetical protein